MSRPTMSPSPFTRKFTLSFITEWRRLDLPFKGGSIVLAVSGGADSCALAAVVKEMTDRKKLSNSVTVAHFDHSLRGEEGRKDAEFVERLAGSMEFGFRTKKAGRSLSRSKSNIEEKARLARYEFLEEVAGLEGASAVLTAHTLNDQAETLLLNLIRGSGLEGLAGMRPVRLLSAGREPESEDEQFAKSDTVLVRPFLRWASREETVKYASEFGIEPRSDAMNDDLSFTRVRVRKELIPNLRSYNPNIVQALARTSESIRRSLILLDADHADLVAAAELARNETLRVSDLLELNESAKNLVIRNWIANRRGGLRGIAKSHVEAVAALAASGRSGRIAELPQFGRVVKSKGMLIFQNRKVEK